MSNSIVNKLDCQENQIIENYKVDNDNHRRDSGKKLSESLESAKETSEYIIKNNLEVQKLSNIKPEAEYINIVKNSLDSIENKQVNSLDVENISTTSVSLLNSSTIQNKNNTLSIEKENNLIENKSATKRSNLDKSKKKFPKSSWASHFDSASVQDIPIMSAKSKPISINENLVQKVIERKPLVNTTLEADRIAQIAAITPLARPSSGEQSAESASIDGARALKRNQMNWLLHRVQVTENYLLRKAEKERAARKTSSSKYGW